MRAHTRTYAHAHMHTHTHRHTHTHTDTHTYTHIHTDIHTHRHTYMHLRPRNSRGQSGIGHTSHIHMHTHAHIHMHTHTHTHLKTLNKFWIKPVWIFHPTCLITVFSFITQDTLWGISETLTVRVWPWGTGGGGARPLRAVAPCRADDLLRVVRPHLTVVAETKNDNSEM